MGKGMQTLLYLEIVFWWNHIPTHTHAHVKQKTGYTLTCCPLKRKVQWWMGFFWAIIIESFAFAQSVTIGYSSCLGNSEIFNWIDTNNLNNLKATKIKRQNFVYTLESRANNIIFIWVSQKCKMRLRLYIIVGLTLIHYEDANNLIFIS